MAENSERKTPRTDSQESRREFVKKAGKLAIYTPPAILLLMQPKTEAIAGSPGGPRHYKPKGFKQKNALNYLKQILSRLFS